jgi:hypothetical protein
MFPVWNILYQSAAAGKQNAGTSLALFSIFILVYFIENLVRKVIRLDGEMLKCEFKNEMFNDILDPVNFVVIENVLRKTNGD